MTTIKFTETFATANANQTVKFDYAGEETIGVIIGYSGSGLLVQTDCYDAWKLTAERIERSNITITSKEPLEYNTRVLFITYDDITEVIKDNPVVTEAESIAKGKLNSFTYALILAIIVTGKQIGRAHV